MKKRILILAVVMGLLPLLSGCWTISGSLLGAGIGGAIGGGNGALAGAAIGAGIGSVADNVEVRNAPRAKSAACRPSPSPYRPRGFFPLARKHYIRVLNGTQWVCKVYTDAHTYIRLWPGGQTDIEFPRMKDSYRIYLTANLINQDGRLVGTAEEDFRIPDWDRQGTSQDIWHIRRYRELE